MQIIDYDLPKLNFFRTVCIFINFQLKFNETKPITRKEVPPIEARFFVFLYPESDRIVVIPVSGILDIWLLTFPSEISDLKS